MLDRELTGQREESLSSKPICKPPFHKIECNLGTVQASPISVKHGNPAQGKGPVHSARRESRRERSSSTTHSNEIVVMYIREDCLTCDQTHINVVLTNCQAGGRPLVLVLCELFVECNTLEEAKIEIANNSSLCRCICRQRLPEF